MTVKAQATPSQTFCKLIGSDESKVQQLPERLQQGLYALEIDHTLCRKHNARVQAGVCLTLGQDIARLTLKELMDPSKEAELYKRIMANHAEVAVECQMISIPVSALEEWRVWQEAKDREKAGIVSVHPDALLRSRPRVFRHKCPCCGEDVWFDSAKDEAKES